METTRNMKSDGAPDARHIRIAARQPCADHPPPRSTSKIFRAHIQRRPAREVGEQEAGDRGQHRAEHIGDEAARHRPGCRPCGRRKRIGRSPRSSGRKWSSPAKPAEDGSGSAPRSPHSARRHVGVEKLARLSGGLMRNPRFDQIAVDCTTKLIDSVAMIGGMRRP